MAELSAVIYDLEIKRCIPPRNGNRELGLEYCDGWEDYANMGISVLCAFDCLTNRALVFMDDNLASFQKLVDQRQQCVGFNNLKFDNAVLAANGVEIPKHDTFDILREIWKASGLDPDSFDFRTHGGFGLDSCCKANFGVGKIDSGDHAPVLWQQGRLGELITYCMDDVMKTRRLFMRGVNQGHLICPKTGAKLDVGLPF